MNNIFFTQGLLSLSFDDGFESAYTLVAPLLEKYSCRGTYYVPSLHVNTQRYLTSHMLRELDGRGHEIGSHTRNHKNLSELTYSEVCDEVILSRTELLQYCEHVSTFAFPFGAYDEHSADAVKIAGYCGACTTVLGANDIWLDQWLLQRRYVRKSTTSREIWRWIATAREQQTWLILCMHDVGEFDDEWSIPLATLSQILEAAKYYSVEILTVRDALQKAISIHENMHLE